MANQAGLERSEGADWVAGMRSDFAALVASQVAFERSIAESSEAARQLSQSRAALSAALMTVDLAAAAAAASPLALPLPPDGIAIREEEEKEAANAAAADANIVTAIDEMAKRRIDAIALTSSGQVRRLIEVAQAHGCEERLRDGLAHTPIASVGPVVSDELKSHGLRTDISPANDAFFMKPLISAMATALGKKPPRNAAAS